MQAVLAFGMHQGSLHVANNCGPNLIVLSLFMLVQGWLTPLSQMICWCAWQSTALLVLLVC